MARDEETGEDLILDPSPPTVQATPGALWILYCLCFLLSAWMLSHAQQQSGWTPLAPATKSFMRERAHVGQRFEVASMRRFDSNGAPVITQQTVTEAKPGEPAITGTIATDGSAHTPTVDTLAAAMHAAEAAKTAAAAATEAANKAHELALAHKTAHPLKQDNAQAIGMITEGHQCALCYFQPVTGKPLPYNYFGERFLFFGLGGQFNNQRQAFTLALWFARLLNRTLIVPTHDGMWLTESFDMWALSHYHPIVPEENMPGNFHELWKDNSQQADTWEWVDIWYLSHADYDADPEQDKWLHSNVMPFVGQPYRARFLLDEFGPESPKWNAPYFFYNQYWGYTRTNFAGFPSHLIDSMTHWQMQVAHFTEVMFELAGRIIHALPKKYLSIHWRLGDYESSAARQPWMLNTDKVLKYFKEVCKVTREEQWTVYIASDSPQHHRIQDFEQRAAQELDMKVVRWDNFQQTMFEPYKHFRHYGKVIHHDPGFKGQVEVIVLAKAAFFIGTGASTFSDHVYPMMVEFGNRAGAVVAQADYDVLTGLNSASYHDEDRPAGFKPAQKETPHSREVEARLLAQLPHKDPKPYR